MKPIHPITIQNITESLRELPAFPAVIQVLTTDLNESNGDIRRLVSLIRHDTDIAAGLLELANRVVRARRGDKIVDVYVAAALLGITRVREVVAVVSIARYLQSMLPPERLPQFWAKSVACASAAVEIAQLMKADVNADLCLVAGLLQIVGMAWLQRFESSRFDQATRFARVNQMSMPQVERRFFGVDHTTIGGWLCLQWSLSPNLVIAVSSAISVDAGNDGVLGDVLHLGRAAAEALDLSKTGDAKVFQLSAQRCKRVGIKWSHGMFGMMEARYRDLLSIAPL